MAERKYFIHFTKNDTGRVLHFHIPWAHSYREDVGDSDEIMQSKNKFKDQIGRIERKLFFDRWPSHLSEAIAIARSKKGITVPEKVILKALPEQFNFDFQKRKTIVSVGLSSFFDSITSHDLKDALLPKMRAREVLIPRAPRS